MSGVQNRLLITFISMLMIWFGVGPPVFAAGKSSQLYFVTVGSSHYATPPDSASHGLPRIYGANKSAKSVAERLLAGGARYGILLTSSEEHLVSTKDVFNAIAQVEKKIKASGSKNPILFFYFSGHGISEGIGWSLFAVPGTFLYPGTLSGQDVEAISTSTIYAAKLVDQLEKSGVQYIAVFDTCYEGNESEFESAVLSGPAIDSLKAVANVLRFMNEFRQSNAVLFSATPGTVVRTVEDPVSHGSTPIAPLARRIMILLDRVATASNVLHVGEFIREMSSPTLDPQSGPAVTNASHADNWSSTLVAYPASPGALDQVAGSAAQGSVCCK